MFRLIKDSSGRPSWTTTLVVLGYFVVLAKYLGSGVTIGKVSFAPIDLISFATAIPLIIAPIVARDYVKPATPGGTNGN